MGLPTLEELGITDKRRKVSDEIKECIRKELQSGKTNITALARQYGVSVCTVRMIKNPEHEKALIRKSRSKKSYYNKEKQKKWNSDLQDRKIKRIYELLGKIKTE